MLSKDELNEAIELRKRLKQIYENVISVDSPTFGIHLTEKAFLGTFPNHVTLYRGGEYPLELYAHYEGQRFFCITDRLKVGDSK